MTSMLPMALFGLEVPPGDVAITARGDIPAAFRITMAAIDPSAEAEGEEGAIPRATLKIIRHSLLDDDDEDDFDIDEMERILGEEYDDDSEDEDDDEDLNGGPSDPTKSKKARKEAALNEILAAGEVMDEDDDEEEIPNGVNGKKSPKALGKMPVSDDDDEEDDDLDDDEMGEEVEELVVCTLDPAKNYQQPLDITIGEDERVLFKVSGTHSIYLTGNYVEPAVAPGMSPYDEDDEDDEDEYDLEPDSDEELDYDDEEDELDDLEDPRIMELDEEEEEEAPALVKSDKKGKNKRPAEDDGLDALIAKSTSKDEEITANGEQKLSKKQLKKLKKNDGTATVTVSEEKKEPENGSSKKVQFAKNLEQGPTPTKDSKEKPKATLGVKKVQGVTIDDKKLGTGPVAKSGDRVGMRYIGKLQKDNKVFDSNKKGKPFTFKLGAGEVIQGWDIGIAGMSVGGERRITIPADKGYGSKGAKPDIPGNATLVFDVKLLEIKGK